MSRAQLTSTDQQNSGGAVAPFSAGKNKLINGDFSVWQRGTSFSAVGYTADRWRLDFGGSGASATVTQQSFTPGSAPVSGYESAYFAQVAATSGSDAGTYITFEQRIEDVRTFAGQTITVSFWAKAASGTPKIGLEVIQNASGSGGSAVYGINSTTKTLSTSWARYSFTFAVPALAQTAAQVGTPNTSLLSMNFWLSNGSSLVTRSGNPGLQTNTFSFWGLQAESGSVMTPFTTASNTLQGELALCQRYFYSLSDPRASLGVWFGTGTAVYSPIKLPVTMRAWPSVTANSTLSLYTFFALGSPMALTSAPSLDTSGYNSVNIGFQTGSGTQGQSGIFGVTGAGGYIWFSAEL
jgi:hypothetical protein